jgi:hypothetical protein
MDRAWSSAEARTVDARESAWPATSAFWATVAASWRTLADVCCRLDAWLSVRLRRSP